MAHEIITLHLPLLCGIMPQWVLCHEKEIVVRKSRNNRHVVYVFLLPLEITLVNDMSKEEVFLCAGGRILISSI